MTGRVLRFDFVLSRSDDVGAGILHTHADVWVAHVRLQQPEVHIFVPMIERRDGCWTFMMAGKEIYANTSYHQIKNNLWQPRAITTISYKCSQSAAITRGQAES